MKELIADIVKVLVDYPKEVHVTEVIGELTIVLELRVAKTDFGKVIGKHGQNVKAMRTILIAAAAKIEKRAVLEILE